MVEIITAVLSGLAGDMLIKLIHWVYHRIAEKVRAPKYRPKHKRKP